MKNCILKLAMLIGIFASLLTSQRVKAQNWSPLGSNTGWYPEAMTTCGDSLIVAFNRFYNSFSDTSIIAIWNGSFWSQLPPIITSVADSLPVKDVIVYNNEIYLSGRFSEVNGIPNTDDIVKWDGNQWASVGGGVDSELVYSFGIRKMQVYNGELYAIGSFTYIGGIHCEGITRWNGTNWNTVGNFSNVVLKNSYYEFFNSILTLGNNLYLGGTFDSIGGTWYNNIASWNGTTWSALNSGFTGSSNAVNVLGSYNGNLFACGYLTQASNSVTINNIASWNGSAWSDASGGNPYVYASSFAQYNGLLWATGDFNFGNYYKGFATWNGTTWDSVPNIPYYTSVLISNSTALYGFYNYWPAMWCNSGNCATITGDVFNDQNGDCILDGSDYPFDNSIITIDGSNYATTDANGNYSVLTGSGTHNISHKTFKYYSTVCPVGGYNLSVTAGNTYNGNNFADQMPSTIQDLGVTIGSMFGWVARIDSTDTYIINYTNYGTDVMSGSVVLQLDTHLWYTSASPAPDAINGNIYTWNFTGLQPGTSGEIQVTTFVPDTLVLHSYVHNIVSILPITGDLDKTNNSDTLVTIVGNSWDPNGKQVSPAGTGVNGDITINDSILTYAIDFQNTGNLSAINIVVVDTLDPTVIDPSTLQMGAYSNSYTYTLTGKGILTFAFKNINLPAKSVNAQKSTGFLQYTVHLRPGLSLGTQIKNAASIYFDFNQPVKTNIALNTIANPSGISTINSTSAFSVFPNPADKTIQIINPSSGNLSYELVNIIGQTVLSGIASNQKTIKLNTSNLLSRIYFVRLKNDSNTTVYKIEIQH